MPGNSSWTYLQIQWLNGGIRHTGDKRRGAGIPTHGLLMSFYPHTAHWQLQSGTGSSVMRRIFRSVTQQGVLVSTQKHLPCSLYTFFLFGMWNIRQGSGLLLEGTAKPMAWSALLTHGMKCSHELLGHSASPFASRLITPTYFSWLNCPDHATFDFVYLMDPKITPLMNELHMP